MHNQDHHDHSPGHHHHHTGNNITLAFWLNTGFALLELAGGFYTNSVAIMSDALHDFGDSVALGSAWYFERKSKTQRDKTYTYGYKRFSLIGALINAVVLCVGSIFILLEAIKRLYDPVQPDTSGMMVLAVLGVLVNGFALMRLRKGKSINERVISLHFLEDVLGWVAVLIGSVIMTFTHAPFIDPLLSIVISIVIVFNVYNNMRGAFQIILQGVPHDVSEKIVKEKITQFAEVESTHDMHLWTMDGVYNILTTHVVLHEPLSVQRLEVLKSRIKKQLKEIKVHHATIEFEVKGLSCDEECINE